MFLITTPHPMTQPKEKDTLLLGEWCRQPAHDAAYTTILPYHWNDRERLYQDYLYLDTLCERMLPRLAQKLNAIHGLDRPVRYWRLIVGYWLSLCAAVMLDRFRSIEAASSQADRTLALPSGGTETITKTTTQFNLACTESDLWNHYCYLDLIRADTAISLLNVTAPQITTEPIPLQHASMRGLAKAGLLQVLRLGLGARPAVVPIGLHISLAAHLELSAKLRQLPFFAPKIAAPPSEIKSHMREQLELDGENKFETTFGKLLPKLIPASFVEDFTYLLLRGQALLPKRPATIITAQFHAGQDALCIWAAEQREHGSHIHIVQHGGHYGTDRFEAAEDHELRIADRYYSWGWTRDGFTNIVPMPALQLSTRQAPRANGKGEILFVYDAICPYSYRMFCIPGAGQRSRYIEDQTALIAALPKDVRAHCRLRLHPLSDTYHFGLREAFTENGWSQQIDTSGHTLQRVLSRSRLCVATANATVPLQTLSADFPTILFWNPSYNELRPSARRHFDALADAGILHYEPRTAARKITEIFNDASIWWQTPSVREARTAFTKQFAYTSESWANDWKHELLRRS